MDGCICRQLGTLFQKADRLAEDARKASSNAQIAQKKDKEHMLQVSREYEERRNELEADITSQRAELSAGRSQLVTHCCCCAMLCKLDSDCFSVPSIFLWPFACQSLESPEQLCACER